MLEFRSSRPELLSKKRVLKNFAKFTGKHLCQSLFLIRLQKKILWHGCFPVNFAKFLRTAFYLEHHWWLLLGDVFNTLSNIYDEAFFRR